MILEFGAKNYLSFKEGLNIFFEIGKAGEKNIAHKDGISNILCLKGKNGAGKTNVLQLLSFFQYINIKSFAKDPEDSFDYYSLFFNKEPTETYMIFEIKDIIYEYEISFTIDRILSESLFMGINKDKLLFQREENESFAYRLDEFDEVLIRNDRPISPLYKKGLLGGVPKL